MNDQLCWVYTFLIVIIQVLVFGRVNGNRVQKRARAIRKIRQRRTRSAKRHRIGRPHYQTTLDGINENSPADAGDIGNGLYPGNGAGVQAMPNERTNEIGEPSEASEISEEMVL